MSEYYNENGEVICLDCERSYTTLAQHVCAQHDYDSIDQYLAIHGDVPTTAQGYSYDTGDTPAISEMTLGEVQNRVDEINSRIEELEATRDEIRSEFQDQLNKVDF